MSLGRGRELLKRVFLVDKRSNPITKCFRQISGCMLFKSLEKATTRWNVTTGSWAGRWGWSAISFVPSTNHDPEDLSKGVNMWVTGAPPTGMPIGLVEGFAWRRILLSTDLI